MNTEITNPEENATENQPVADQAAKTEPEFTGTLILSRITHVVAPDMAAEDPPLFFQAVSGDPSNRGRVLTLRTYPELYKAIVGSSTSRTVDYGLRGRTKSQFYARTTKARDGKGTAPMVVALDIVPQRVYLSRSATPVEVRDAVESGIEAEWDARIRGFVVDKVYLGLDHPTLDAILKAMRLHDFGNSLLMNFEGHRIEKLDAVRYRIKSTRPISAVRSGREGR